MPHAISLQAKKMRRVASQSLGRTTVAYAMRGKKVFRAAFVAVLHLSEKKVQRHAQSVASCNKPELYTTNHNEAKQGKQGVQKVVVYAFLRAYPSNHSLECPDERGSQDKSPLRLLPGDHTRVKVHEENTWFAGEKS